MSTSIASLLAQGEPERRVFSRTDSFGLNRMYRTGTLTLLFNTCGEKGPSEISSLCRPFLRSLTELCRVFSSYLFFLRLLLHSAVLFFIYFFYLFYLALLCGESNRAALHFGSYIPGRQRASFAAREPETTSCALLTLCSFIRSLTRSPPFRFLPLFALFPARSRFLACSNSLTRCEPNDSFDHEILESRYRLPVYIGIAFAPRAASLPRTSSIARISIFFTLVTSSPRASR